MIPFEADKLRVEYVKLKSVSAALQGSMRLLNVAESEEQGHDITTRTAIPFAVARQFGQRNAVKRFIVARDAAVVWYGDQVVMIELRPATKYKENWDGTDKWTSTSEISIAKHILPKTKNGDWFTDGVYIYQLPDMQVELPKATNLTKDGMFRGVSVNCLAFKHLLDPLLISDLHTRSIVAVIAADNSVSLTPPIWKNILQIRSSKISENEKNKAETNKEGRFDIVQQKFDVNLEFALNAGRVVGKVFGNDHLEPLRLPELMINLCTVNLPKVPRTIRETYGVGLPFLHAFAWLTGKMVKCDSMTNYLAMRGLMKLLLTKGLFRSDLIKKVNEVKRLNVSPPMMDKQEALASVTLNHNPQQIQDYWMKFAQIRDRRRSSTESNANMMLQQNTVGTVD